MIARFLIGSIIVSTLSLGVATVALAEELSNIAVYAGSTGTGVSVEALARLEEAERYLQNAKGPDGRSIRYVKSYPGLEGEVMLCVQLQDPFRRESVLADLRRIVGPAARISIEPSRCVVR